MSASLTDPEILYAQKIYYFFFLLTLTSLTTAFVMLVFSFYYGLFTMAFGIGISYILMLLKRNFHPPEKVITAKRMAHTISQNTSPSAIACFAIQLYYYFQESNQAIDLLEKFLPSNDPLIYATLGDILLKEGKTKQALYILRGNPYALIDPLLLATQARVLKQIGRVSEAAKLFERSIHIATQNGFPKIENNWLTQKILTMSHLAGIHHSLADCYFRLENFSDAKKHYHAGNRLLIDISLWRNCPSVHNHSTKIHKKTY
ncbi:hypothetical protein Desor_3462 [Desulfosporosinus orientis DSM 765]|uniref:Tetratricopeptide repeat protein n=1 Tax=Desulfosporosinus orientis (strain ATCC 19365 / DSM 765 / NCIMB 8382 / VKM B-1628 / Singapore I) TaxID=768706 RepID=G7WFS8_DESOD|nr:hypothetical protein [Desulfosporosinus orientis]AET68951.1 hypothetical protein Desor_3462 [Desulfosporosinus orientis DSM 765]